MRMEPVQRDILDKIEQTPAQRVHVQSGAHVQARQLMNWMADIFNSFDRQTEARFIGALEERTATRPNVSAP